MSKTIKPNSTYQTADIIEYGTAAAYVRVSTDDQLDYSPESQLDEIKAYAKRNGFYIPACNIFMETEGHSGKKADNRFEFQRMIAIAKQKPKPFEVILVWKFSRFARNQDESTFYKSLLRKKLGIDVISVSEPIMEGMYGRLIEMIIEWQDEFYSYNLGVEVTRGMTKKAQKGEPQVIPPLGYRIPYKGALPEIVPDEADIVKLIFKLFLEEDMGIFGIARYLSEHGVKGKRGGGIWSDSIKRILTNPYYAGYCRWNGIVEKGTFTSIISKEDFDKANAILSKNGTQKYKKPEELYRHWLSGIIYCSSCGKSLASQRIHSNRKDYLIFQCCGYTKGVCHTSHYVRADKIEKAVIEDLEDVIALGNVDFSIRNNSKNTDSQIDFIRTQITRTHQRLERARESYMAGIDTMEEYKASKASLLKELNTLENREKDMTIIPEKAEEIMLQNIRTVCDILKSDTHSTVQKNNSIKSIIEKVVYDKEKQHVDIYYYIDESDLLPLSYTQTG